MSETGGGDLLSEWRRLMDAVVRSAGSVAGRSELPRQLVEPMQRQLELVQEVLERERALRGEITGRLVAPIDAVFDLLQESAATMRRQAEALQSAGRALEDTAALMKTQAELFDRTVSTVRQPVELAKFAGGVERRRPRDEPDAG